MSPPFFFERRASRLKKNMQSWSERTKRIDFAQKCRSWHEEIVLASRVPSYGVVPGEAQLKKEAGLPS